jgi:hypothetical protein
VGANLLSRATFRAQQEARSGVTGDSQEPVL